MNNIYYFASSNSMNGFHSYFEKIYDSNKLKRIYIIKGGPGTGKSTMIKRIAEEFEDRAKCERFICSSDVNSLDGLIINNQIAVIDGTAPHATEAKYPGAVEVIVDNAKAVKSTINCEKKKISELMRRKSKLYQSGYIYLKAIGEIKKEHINEIELRINNKKLDGAINRLFKNKLKKGANYSEEIRLISGITPSGEYNTHSFEKLSNTIILITNGKGYEEIIYKKIIEAAKLYGIKTTVSFDPLLPYSPNALMFNDLKICVVSYDKKEHGEIDYDKYIVLNTERFIDKSLNTGIKNRLKFAEKCSLSLKEEAIRYFSEAKSIHEALENLYAKHIDFEIIDNNAKPIIGEIKDIL